MTRARTVLILGAAAGGLGTFLPWASLGKLISVNGTRGDGWISLALFAIVGLVASTGRDGLTAMRRGIAIVSGLCAGALGIYEIVHIKRTAKVVSVGAGLYLIVAAAAVVVVAISLMARTQEPRP